MNKDVSDALSGIDGRLDVIEATMGNYLADHTGWLLAMQAITAVGMVRHMTGAENPREFLATSRKWSSDIVDTTSPADTIPAETMEKIRTMAHEKLDRFFNGISIKE